MGNQVKQAAAALELEEKILNGACLAALICVFLPWFGGEWLGGELVTYTGLGFYTGGLGLSVFFLHLLTLLITVLPISGGPELVKRHSKHGARLIASGLCVALSTGAWSVLTLVTFDFSRMEVHYGLYGCIISSLVTLLYSFLLYQDQRKREVQGLFHHPHSQTDRGPHTPPAPPPADQHRMHP